MNEHKNDLLDYTGYYIRNRHHCGCALRAIVLSELFTVSTWDKPSLTHASHTQAHTSTFKISANHRCAHTQTQTQAQTQTHTAVHACARQELGKLGPTGHLTVVPCQELLAAALLDLPP